MILIACSETLDGIASAAIILRHAMLKNLPVSLAATIKPGNLTENLLKIAKQKKQLIFLLDLTIEEEHLPILEILNKNNKIVYWNGSEKSIKPEAAFIDSAPKTASAELAMKRFLPNDQIAKKLAGLAHDIKFWELRETRAGQLSDLISFGFSPHEMVKSMAKGVTWNEKFEDYYNQHKQKKAEAIENLKKTLIIKHYLKYRFAYARASRILNSADACQNILDKHAGVDVAAVLYRDGRFVLRKRDSCSLDLTELAALFKGGGQAYAAGAGIDMTITNESYPDAVLKLDKAFRAALLSSKV